MRKQRRLIHQDASLPLPVATDVTMASGEAGEVVSVSSATPELAEEATLPSSQSVADGDSQMGSYCPRGRG